MTTELDRAADMHAFLEWSGWSAASVTPLVGDASTRRYFRVAQDGRRAMLMDQPQNAETPASPVDATPQERRALGYNAIAHLAGADCGRFIAVANFLRANGLSTPQIYDADVAKGFVLLEDLGADLYADAIASGQDEHAIYGAAVDALAHLHVDRAPTLLAPDTPLHTYDETAQLAEIELMTEWFIPMALERKAGDEEVTEHRQLWRDALNSVRTDHSVFVHRDFHSPNLIWLPERHGIARAGIIDFQDAVAGTRSYDLISLVQDARRDIVPELGEAMTKRYLAAMKALGQELDEDAHRAEMAVIAAQRNAKIAGIFARLYKRDGKPRYLAHLPRIWRYLSRDLEHPALGALKAWYDRTIPSEVRGAPMIKGAIA